MIGHGLLLLATAAAVSLTLLGLAAAVRRRLLIVTVQGVSMEPALHAGDRVLASRRVPERLHPGQMVVFENPDQPGRWMIKRVTAVAGDPIPRSGFPALADATDTTVPPGHLVVLGDNRARSHDSRHIGFLPRHRVKGVVLRRLFS